MYRPPFLASSSSASASASLSGASMVPGGAGSGAAHPRALSPNLYPPSAPGSTSNRLHSTGYSHPAAPSTQHRPTPLAGPGPGAHPAAVQRQGPAPVLPTLKIHLSLQPPPSSIEQHRPPSSASTQPLAMPIALPIAMPIALPIALPMTVVNPPNDGDDHLTGRGPDSPTLSALSDLSSLYQDDDELESMDQDGPEASSKSSTKRVSGGGGRKRKLGHLDADQESSSFDGSETHARFYSLTQEDHALGLGYSQGTLKPFVCRGCSRRWKHRSGFTAHLETGCPRPFSASKKRKSATGSAAAAAIAAASSSSSSSASAVLPVMGSASSSASSSSGVATGLTTRSAAATRSRPPQPPPVLPPPPPPAVAAVSRSTAPMPTPPLTPLESPMVPAAGGRLPPHPPPTTAAGLLRKPDQPLHVVHPAPAAAPKPPARRGRPRRLHPANSQAAHPPPPPTAIHCPCGQAHPPTFTGTAPRPFTPPPPASTSASAGHPHVHVPAAAARPPTSTTPLAGPAINPDTRVPMSAWPKCTLCAALGHPSCVAAQLMVSGHKAWFCTRCELTRLATAKPARRVPRSAIMAPLVGAGGRILPMRRPVGASREEMELPSLARHVRGAQANAEGVYVAGGWMADRTAIRFPSVKTEGAERETGLMVAGARPVARRPTRVVVVSMRKADGDKPSVEQVAREGRDELYRKLAERRPVSPPVHPATPKISGSRPSALVLDHSTHAHQQQQQQPPPPSSTLSSSATSALVKEDFVVPWRSSPVCLSPVLPEPLQSTPRRAAAAASSTASYMTTTTPLRGPTAPGWPASPSTILGSVHRNGGSSASSTEFDDFLGGLASGRSPASPLLPFPLGSMLGGLASLEAADVLSSPSPKVTLGNAQRNGALGSPLKGKVKRAAEEAENGSSQQHHQQRTPSPPPPASPVMSSLDKELARHVPAYRLPPSKRIRSMPALHFNKARRGSSAAAAGKSGMLSAASKGLCPSSSSSSFGGIPPMTTSPDLPPDWHASKLLCSPPPLTITPSFAAAASLLVASTPRQSTSNPVGWAGLIHLPSPMPTPCGDSLSAPIDLAMTGAGAADLMMLMSPLASPTQMAFSSPLASNAGSMYAHSAPPPLHQHQQQHKVEYGRYGTPGAAAAAAGPYSSLAPARTGMAVWSSSSPAPQAREEEAGLGWDESFDDMVSLEPMDA